MELILALIAFILFNKVFPVWHYMTAGIREFINDIFSHLKSK